MDLYYVTTPEKAAAIMRRGFQDADINDWASDILGYGVVQPYDVRPGPDGSALLASRRVNVTDEGVEVRPGPLRLMGWHPPEQYRWLRVRLDLSDEAVAQYKIVEEDTPQELSEEERHQRMRGIEEGRIPPDPPIDWGYGEYMVPLDVLRAHAHTEGPFTCDAETADPILETTAKFGIDIIADVEGEEPPC